MNNSYLFYTVVPKKLMSNVKLKKGSICLMKCLAVSMFSVIISSLQALGMDDTYQIRFPHLITASAASPDGRFIAAGSCDGSISIVDTHGTGTIAMTKYIDRSRAVTALAINSLGIAIGYCDGIVTILDRDLHKQKEIAAHNGLINKIIFDGCWIATSAHDNCVKVWHCITDDCFCLLNTDHPINQIAISIVKHMICIPQGNDLLIWDFIKNKECVRLLGHGIKNTALVCHGSQLWSSSNDKTLCLWDITSGACLKNIKFHKIMSSLCISPDNLSLLGVSMGGSGCAWDMTSGMLIDRVCRPKLLFLIKSFVSGNSVVYEWGNGLVGIRTIACHRATIPFYNELSCPIRDIKIIDSFKRISNQDSSCNPCNFTNLCLAFRDVLSRYYIHLGIEQQEMVFKPFFKLKGARKILLTQNIKTGRVELQIARSPMPLRDGVEWEVLSRLGNDFEPEPKSGPMSLFAYFMGKPFKSMELQDNVGNRLNAQSYGGLNSLWTFDGVCWRPPFTLTASTDQMNYRWRMQFLSSDTELMFIVPEVRQPLLKLFMEASAQEYTVPLLMVCPT